MEDPAVMWKFMAFDVISYIPFLKYICVFVLTSRISGLPTGLHAKEKCTCDQLSDGYVQMGLCLLVDARH